MVPKDSIKCILFDCMETLVDFNRKLTVEDYARWAFYGSGCEDLWINFDVFFDAYVTARRHIPTTLAEHQEYDFIERIQTVARSTLAEKEAEEIEAIAQQVYNHYWNQYASNCFVRDDVRETLPVFANRYQLGVVSNFMNDGGIEELLERNGITQYFGFVITSIREGWRKPHKNIYDAALAQTNAQPHEILFVGDNYQCDYLAPKTLGMHAILLDRNESNEESAVSIRSFHDLLSILT